MEGEAGERGQGQLIDLRAVDHGTDYLESRVQRDGIRRRQFGQYFCRGRRPGPDFVATTFRACGRRAANAKPDVAVSGWVDGDARYSSSAHFWRTGSLGCAGGGWPG